MPRFSVHSLLSVKSACQKSLCVAGLLALTALPLRHACAFETVRCPLAEAFDFPVGKPDSKGYHKARGFWPNGHLGEDWNGNGGGDTDEGDPIYAIATGVVVLSENVHVGWGNVVIVRHVYREVTGKIEMVDSLYGHLLERKVRVGQMVDRGQLVGTMGSNFGMYPVHLHLEIRKNLAIGMNRSKFARDYTNYHSPTSFINAHRQLTGDQRRYDVPVDTFAPYGGELTDAQQEVSRSTSPTTFTHRSASSSVTRTSRGLSIPVPGATGGYTPGAVAPAGTTAPKTSSAGSAKGSAGAGKTGSGRGKESGTIVIKPPPAVVSTPPEAEPRTIPKTNASIAPPPPPPPSTETKSDFWTRLKSKLSSGQVTPGVEEKK